MSSYVCSLIFTLCLATFECVSISGKGHSKPVVDVQPAALPPASTADTNEQAENEGTNGATEAEEGGPGGFLSRLWGKDDEAETSERNPDGVELNTVNEEEKKEAGEDDLAVVDLSTFDVNQDGVVDIDEFRRGVNLVNEIHGPANRGFLGIECPTCGVPKAPDPMAALDAVPGSSAAKSLFDVEANTNVDVQVSVLPKCCGPAGPGERPVDHEPRTVSEEVAAAIEAYKAAEDEKSTTSESESEKGSTNIALINLDVDIDIDPVAHCCSCKIFTWLKAKIQAGLGNVNNNDNGNQS